MEIISELTGKKVGVDTAPFIYFIEKHPEYHNVLKEIFRLAAKKQIHIITSIITLIEVMVHPLRLGHVKLAERYEQILSGSDEILLADVTSEVGCQAAVLRSKYNIKTPDAIQISASLVNDAEFFITNDKRLKSIKEIKVI